MDSLNSVETLRPEPTGNVFSTQNILIIVLVILLIFSFLGINLLFVSGNVIQTIMAIFGPLVAQILSIFGYTAGTLINKTADIAGDTAKTGIDIAEGTVHSVGNILRDASQGNVNWHSKTSLDNALNSSNTSFSNPAPDSSENPIQNSIATNKAGWCLVGEYQGRRGCIAVSEQDKCLSGQVYPSQKMCLNPVLTPNAPYRPIPPPPPVYTPGSFFGGFFPPPPVPPPAIVNYPAQSQQQSQQQQSPPSSSSSNQSQQPQQQPQQQQSPPPPSQSQQQSQQQPQQQPPK